ncbi:MAG: GntR family transcriptional regulator [Acidobacteria bacterium]|nr:GntR family transcriptional regulator [Acidobacteriota bacterium]
MKIWLSKNSEVPLREQIITQITLGIISGDLPPAQKLPSTRELSHRLEVHANTVSAAYRGLASRGWVEFRKGSGVYVRELNADAAMDAALELDRLIAKLFQEARSKGYAMSEIAARVKRWLDAQPPQHFLLIEPDEELRNILAAEILQATGFSVATASIEACASKLVGAAPITLYSRAEQVRAALPPDTSFMLLHMRSVSDELQGKERPTREDLITVVSRWRELFKWSRTVLVAAGIDPETICFRHPDEADWQKGLHTNWLVITDALTAERMPPGCNFRVFRIIADASLDELRNFKDFLSKPLASL